SFTALATVLCISSIEEKEWSNNCISVLWLDKSLAVTTNVVADSPLKSRGGECFVRPLIKWDGIYARSRHGSSRQGTGKLKSDRKLRQMAIARIGTAGN